MFELLFSMEAMLVLIGSMGVMRVLSIPMGVMLFLLFPGEPCFFYHSQGSHDCFFLFKFNLFTFNSITVRGLTCGLALKQNFCLNFQKISLLQIATVCYRRADQLSHMMSAESLPSFVSNLVRMLSSWITWFPYDFQVED